MFMKCHNPSPLRVLLIGSALVFAGLGTVNAADYFLHQDQASGWNWSTTAAGNTNSWYDAQTGGSIITSMDSAGTYHTNGHLLRTPSVSSSTTFAGNTLVVDNLGTLSLKMTNSGAIANVGHLITSGTAAVSASNANNQYHSLSVTTFDQAGTTNFTAVATRSFNLAFADLNGSGTINLSGADATSFFNLNFTDASGFSGSLNLTGGTMSLVNSLTTAGSLSLSSGSVVQLSQSITVTALSIGGTSLSAGTYSYGTLNSSYDAYFADGAYTGSITVAAIPEPANAAIIFAAMAGLAVWRRKRRD